MTEHDHEPSHHAHDQQAHDQHGHGQHGHGHGHVHIDEADWSAWAEHTELEGELFLAAVTDAVTWADQLRADDAPPVRRILDIGSGPGVATCELARLYPDATVVAVDGSPAMLERAAQRALANGVAARVSTHLAELPGGLDELQPVDMIWASMSLHHIGDEVTTMRVLRDRLDAQGLIVISEFGDPMRFLPDDLDLAPPGLADRFDEASQRWFTQMRAGLPGSVQSADFPTMLAQAGFVVLGSRIDVQRLDAPLSAVAREALRGDMQRLRHQLDGFLNDDDLGVLDTLIDQDDPRGIVHRDDMFFETSRHVMVARPA